MKEIKQNGTMKISIIGGGNLGTAIAEGLIKSAVYQPSDITITRRNVKALEKLAEKGVQVSSNNHDAIAQADMVILAVKPFQIAEILKDTVTAFKAEQIVISVITGVSIEDIKQIITQDIILFRAMPNTAIAIQQSMTCLSYAKATEMQVQKVLNVFELLGKTTVINEQLMDAATVLAACGTAYALRYIRANIQAGIEIGFDAKTASLIAAQTTKGAAELLLINGSHPEQEIDKVTTPKGCTIVGLNEMEHRGFSSSLIRGVICSYKKIAKD